MDQPSGIERMLTGLLSASHLASVERLPSVVAEHAAHAGLTDVVIYIADLQQEYLHPLGYQDGASSLRIDGTLAGRGFQSVQATQSGPENADGPTTWWVPLLDGTERLGMLRVRVQPDTDTVTDTGTDTVADTDAVADTDTVADTDAESAMEHLASVVALILVSYRLHSDSFARMVRSRPMNIAAEMQWNLMPPLTTADDDVVIGAVLEPAYEVGGDAFDYARSGDKVHLAVFDAMGHNTSASLTATLAMAACRNHRREGGELAHVGEAIEAALIEQFGQSRYATALIAELNTRTGALSWVNRGHPPPVVIREGHWVATLACRPSHPLGTALGLPTTVCHAQLQPGDRVLLYTDGITEARSSGGQQFGLARFVDFIIRRDADGLPVPETLRRLIRSVLEYHDGLLSDDATVLLVEWKGMARLRLFG